MLTVLGACRGWAAGYVGFVLGCIFSPFASTPFLITDMSWLMMSELGVELFHSMWAPWLLTPFFFPLFLNTMFFSCLLISLNLLFISFIVSTICSSLPHSPHLSVLSNRPSVRCVSIEGKDPHVKPCPHAEGREAHDLWVPSASSGLWRHQSGILPQTEQDDEEGKFSCKLWPVTSSQNHNLVGTSYRRILPSLPWLQRDVAFWWFVVFLLFVFGLCFSSYYVLLRVFWMFSSSISFFPSQQSVTVLGLFVFLCSI